MSQYPAEYSYLTLTATSTTATAGFTVPRGVRAMTIIAPNLTTDTTFNIQMLDPRTANGGSETWATLSVHDLIDGTASALTPADNSTTMVWPAPSGSVLRISYTTSQTATFVVIFHY